jgi:enoyl-CoA hydratase
VDQILLARDGPIATIALSNPGRLNALTQRMWDGIGAMVSSLSADESVRCIVMRGADGSAFAAGADISEFANARQSVEQAREYGRSIQRTIDAILGCRHPIVAMIQGVCVGGGLELASVCDLRICGASSRFGVPVAKLGLVMAYGELKGLIELVGKATALEIVLEARVFDAVEAKQKGLVNRVVADDHVEAETMASAARIAAGAPLVARWHKKFARRLVDPRPLTPAEYDESFACFGTEDFQIGYQAFLAKRTPEFKGR